ncbi:unnamed protein product [Nezara viridula]|uniref:Uncharacterized protein n=1 Tax=Nezara viridula TaxID=85310 RepID=A0A9P0EAE9_NEZVI|nr:unnamed protein product [Nezara viridula]
MGVIDASAKFSGEKRLRSVKTILKTVFHAKITLLHKGRKFLFHKSLQNCLGSKNSKTLNQNSEERKRRIGNGLSGMEEYSSPTFECKPFKAADWVISVESGRRYLVKSGRKTTEEIGNS